MEEITVVQVRESNEILQQLLQLKELRDHSTLKTLQNILKLCQKGVAGNTSEWKPILIKLLELITTVNIEDQQALLAGRIFCTLLPQLINPENFENYIKNFLQLSTNELCIFENNFKIIDQEMVKLLIIYGCLSIDLKDKLSYEICIDFFYTLKKHCAAYTEFTWTAFRILKLWLEYTRKIDFWKDNNQDIEEQLYCLIISNWDNCINDVVRWNATEIFPIYLKIMQKKDPLFLENSRNIVSKQLSSRNPTKYMILKEIYQIMIMDNHHNDNISIENSDIEEILESLCKSHLKHVTTKLYFTIWGNMSESNWLNFYQTIYPIIEKWERENNLNGLQALWDLWFKITLPKFSINCFYMLWYNFFKNQMFVSQSFLAKLAVEKIKIKLITLLEKAVGQLRADVDNGKISDEEYKCIVQSNIWITRDTTGAPIVLDDERDCVRLNGFAVYCQGSEFISETKYNYLLKNTGFTCTDDPTVREFSTFYICKRFLYLNAKAASNTMRKGIILNFEIFVSSIVSKLNENEVNNFLQFIHEFILNCFEMNSCYQRKIMGLSILRIILIFLSKSSKYSYDKFWINENKNNLYIFSRLCIDNVEEIREKACEIFSTYLAPRTSLTDKENEDLFREAMKHCCSSKFHQVCGGAKLLKIITAIGKDADFSNYLLEEAQRQLSAMKIDILKATADGSPFYGTIRALLDLYFYNDEKLMDYSRTKPIHLMDELLGLLEEASNFFLSSLAPKSKSNDIAYSSSFAEMGIAIEEIICNSEIAEDCMDDVHSASLSPAHQTIISCVWMSLATICQLAGELTFVKLQKEEIYKRSIDIVITILTKCRHKGVIEAAGCVLVRLMNNKNLSQEYFIVHLDKLLNLDTQDKVNLTRRGAGHTIMFHKLVTYGYKKTRPLLNIALDRILGRLKISMKIERACSATTTDDPIARQIHFLRTVVSDKSLHPALVQYMEEISLTCFHYLGSTEWPIRNASLQLLGAIIPRLIGAPSDRELDFSTGYSIEHFFTHYPKLADKLIDDMKDHSKTMPLLTLLSKMTVAGCEYIDYSSSKQYTGQVALEIYSLFNHPVGAVRNLAAKTYAAFIPPHKIPPILFTMASTNISDNKPNFKHSYFLTQLYLYIRAKNESVCWNTGENAKKIRQATDLQLKRLDKCFSAWCQDQYQINYIAEATCIEGLLLSVQLKHCHPFKISKIGHTSIIRKCKSQQSQPGYWHFIDCLTKIHWQFANFDECLIDNLQILYNINEYIIYLINNAKDHLEELPVNDQTHQSYRQFRIDFLLHLLEIVDCSIETGVEISQLLVEFVEQLVKYCNPNWCEADKRLKILYIANKCITSKINILRNLGTTILTKLIIIEDYLNNQLLTDTLVSIFNEIQHEDGSVAEIKLNCLKNFLQNNDLSKMTSQIRNRIIENSVAILSNEDPETRLLVNNNIMNYFKQCPRIISVCHQSSEVNYSELYLYDILQIGVSSYLSSTTIDKNLFIKLKNFIETILCTNISKFTKHEKSHITNPFSCDDGYREDGKICDFLIYLITYSSRIHPTTSLDIEKLIEIGNSIQKKYIEALKNKNNCSELGIILSCNSYAYVEYKIHTLCGIIEEKQCYM